MTKQEDNIDPITKEIEDRVRKQIIKDTAIEFSKKIEATVWEQDISYMEAIANVMEAEGYEPEVMANMITSDLKAKLQEEGERLSLIKKTNHRLEI